MRLSPVPTPFVSKLGYAFALHLAGDITALYCCIPTRPSITYDLANMLNPSFEWRGLAALVVLLWCLPAFVRGATGVHPTATAEAASLQGPVLVHYRQLTQNARTWSCLVSTPAALQAGATNITSPFEISSVRGGCWSFPFRMSVTDQFKHSNGSMLLVPTIYTGVLVGSTTTFSQCAEPYSLQLMLSNNFNAGLLTVNKQYGNLPIDPTDVCILSTADACTNSTQSWQLVNSAITGVAGTTPDPICCTAANCTKITDRLVTNVSLDKDQTTAVATAVLPLQQWNCLTSTAAALDTTSSGTDDYAVFAMTRFSGACWSLPFNLTITDELHHDNGTTLFLQSQYIGTIGAFRDKAFQCGDDYSLTQYMTDTYKGGFMSTHKPYVNLPTGFSLDQVCVDAQFKGACATSKLPWQLVNSGITSATATATPQCCTQANCSYVINQFSPVVKTVPAPAPLTVPSTSPVAPETNWNCPTTTLTAFDLTPTRTDITITAFSFMGACWSFPFSLTMTDMFMHDNGTTAFVNSYYTGVATSYNDAAFQCGAPYSVMDWVKDTFKPGFLTSSKPYAGLPLAISDVCVDGSGTGACSTAVQPWRLLNSAVTSATTAASKCCTPSNCSYVMQDYAPDVHASNTAPAPAPNTAPLVVPQDTWTCPGITTAAFDMTHSRNDITPRTMKSTYGACWSFPFQLTITDAFKHSNGTVVLVDAKYEGTLVTYNDVAFQCQSPFALSDFIAKQLKQGIMSVMKPYQKPPFNPSDVCVDPTGGTACSGTNLPWTMINSTVTANTTLSPGPKCCTPANCSLVMQSYVPDVRALGAAPVSIIQPGSSGLFPTPGATPPSPTPSQPASLSSISFNITAPNPPTQLLTNTSLQKDFATAVRQQLLDQYNSTGTILQLTVTLTVLQPSPATPTPSTTASPSLSPALGSPSPSPSPTPAPPSPQPSPSPAPSPSPTISTRPSPRPFPSPTIRISPRIPIIPITSLTPLAPVSSSVTTSTTLTRKLQQATPSSPLQLIVQMVGSDPTVLPQSADALRPAITAAITVVGLPAFTYTVVVLTPLVVVQGPPATPTSAPSSGSSSGGTSTGTIVGIVVGVVVGVLLLLGLVILIVVRRRRNKEGQPSGTIATSSVQKQQLVSAPTYKTESQQYPAYSVVTSQSSTPPLAIPGLALGELFTREAAHDYSWIDTAHPEAVAVESGLNDVQLDRLVQVNRGKPHCPVVQLTRAELQQQVHLVKDGLLGKGGSALAFKCVWPSRFGPYAVLAAKVLKEGYTSDMAVLGSFCYEANVLSNAVHPNIVRLYGYCLDPPNVCVLLELLPYSLKDLLYGLPSVASSWKGSSAAATATDPSRSTLSTQTYPSQQDSRGLVPSPLPSLHPTTPGPSHGGPPSSTPSTPQGASTVSTHPLTVLQVLQISAQITEGLTYLHDKHAGTDDAANTTLHTATGQLVSAGQLMQPVRSVDGAGQGNRVVHRDMKPANIMFNSRGVVKITDFGLAREHEHTTVPTVHVGAGTLRYMAPELLSGSNLQHGTGIAPTNRVDVYSFGMMLWEMLSGEVPWKGMPDTAVMAAVISGRRPQLPSGEAQAITLTPDMAQQPASLGALPPLNAIIAQCWEQRELRRPRAADVHRMLCALLTQLGHNVQAPAV